MVTNTTNYHFENYSIEAKVRDAQRIADINQLRSAAELYFDDNSGHYPTALTLANIGKYLADSTVLPNDPVTKLPYNYAYDSGSLKRFHLWTELETKSGGLLADADINSSDWSGSTIDASSPSTEACTADYNKGIARDCIYDVGQN